MLVGVGQGVLYPDLKVDPTTQCEGGGLPLSPPLKHLDRAPVLPPLLLLLLLLPLPQHLEAPVLLPLLPLRVLLVTHHHVYSGYQLHLELKLR